MKNLSTKSLLLKSTFKPNLSYLSISKRYYADPRLAPSRQPIPFTKPFQKGPTAQERVANLYSDIPEEKMIEVTVNQTKVKVPSGVTVLQACEAAGVNVPRFCYHDRLSIAGNCRMCLVEVEKAKKPVASCANPIMPGMVIKTDTDMVKFAREGVVEFLLANHPLDCPICDQGGECDLQDITMTFGSLQARMHEDKRCVEDKDLGPFVATSMNRCIHCTRCVRFADEICGTEQLGTTGRGNATEVGTYIEDYFDSELSGNVIDLCPVGALTNRQSKFKIRPWDITIVETIDVMEPTHANIVLDTRFNELIRIKPRLNEDVNEEWISDKTRFCVDGLKRQRLDMPLIKNYTTGLLEPSTWPDALKLVSDKIINIVNENSDKPNLKAITGDLIEVESMLALKDFMNALNCNNTVSNVDNTNMIDCDLRTNYLFNSLYNGIEDADLCLIIGSNPRMEAPLINAKLRKAYLNGLNLYLIGNNAILNYEKEILGNDLSALEDIVSGNSSFCSLLEQSEYPLIIVGQSALKDSHYQSTQSLLNELTLKYPNIINKDNNWNGISYLQARSNRNAALDIGFVPGPNISQSDNENVKLLYLLGCDDFNDNDIPNNAFIVYQGSHGDRGASIADVILPGMSFIEKNGTYVNIDGRVQRTKQAVSSPGQSRVDWQIIRALSEMCGVSLNYDNTDELRRRLIDIAPHFSNVDEIEIPQITYSLFDEIKNNNNNINNDKIQITTKQFDKYYNDYFKTDAISRSSLTLSTAQKQLKMSNNSWC